MATGTIPIPITDKVLTAHSVAEPSPGETAWTSGATFALGDKCILGAPSSTVTISNANPAVVMWNGHGLPDGTPVILSTTGALPTGLSTATIYYVVNRTTNTFQLSETVDGAPLATTSAGSPTHTATASIHRTYKSTKVGSNTGNPPAIDDGTNWLDIGPTNLAAMLDLYRPSITWGTSPMTFTLTPGRVIRSLFFGSLVATEIQIVQKRAGVAIKSWTRELLTRSIQGYADYFFKPFTVQQSVQILDTLLYSDCTFEVTITRSGGGQVGIGEVVQGNPVYLGKTQYGSERKHRNFTKFDRNTDGTPNAPVKQRNVPSSPQTIVFDKAAMPAILQFIEDANGQVVVISGLDDDADPYFEPLLILGLITQADVNISNPTKATLSLVAEEY